MIRIEVWGDKACFTRPEFKVERISYDVITPSAARGILDCVYWHPGLKWKIDRIYVLNPIKYVDFKRNEVKTRLNGNKAIKMMNGGCESLFLDAVAERTQRTTKALKNVHYVLEAHFQMTKNVNPQDTPGKFYAITRKRLEKGRCSAEPYFGCREFPVAFREWNGGDNIPTIDDTKDLGYMFFDYDYSRSDNIRPIFFHAKMIHGVISLTDVEKIGIKID